MMNNDISIETFLERLGSAAPTPGGGAAAALTSALGASLIMMVTNNTLEKKKCLEFKDLQVSSRSEAHMIKERLTSCIEKDAIAYAKVAAAYRIPRSIAKFENIPDIRDRLTDLDTDFDLSEHLKRLDYAFSVRGKSDKISDLPEDLVQLLDVSYKATRDELLAHASIEASEVPLSVMEDSLAAMKIADELIGKSYKPLESDLLTAERCLHSGILSSKAFVQANGPAIFKVNPSLADEMRQRAEEIVIESGRIVEDRANSFLF